MDKINANNCEKIVLYNGNTSSDDDDNDNDNDNDNLKLQQFLFMKSHIRCSFLEFNNIYGKSMQILGNFQTLHGYKESENLHFLQECLSISERSVHIMEFWKQIIKPYALSIFRFIPKNDEQEDLMLQIHKYYMDKGKIGEIFDQDKYLCLVPIQPGHWYPHTQHCYLGPNCRGFRVYRKCLFLVLIHKSDLTWA